MLTARSYLSRSKNVPDTSLLKDSISLTSSSSSDSQEIYSDATVKMCTTVKSSNTTRLEYKDRLEALWKTVSKPSSKSTNCGKLAKSVRVKTPKEVYVHRVADAKPKTSNDIIWNAYATTKSFKAIIQGVVKTQAVARRWLVLKEKRDVELMKAQRAVKIQSVWRRVLCRKSYLVAVEEWTKRAERRKMEEGMASKIAAAWRGYRCLVIYESIVIDVVLIQSVVRQFLAQRKVQAMCLRRERAAATMIQAKWRSVASAKQYVDTKSKVVLLQCFVRQMMATIRLNQLQEEKRVMQAAMATRISTAWRRAHCQAVFKNTVKSIIECQLIVRTFLAWKLLARLKHDVEVDAATCIQSEARGYLAREHFMKLKCSAIVVQSTARRLAAVRKLHYLRWRRILLKKDKATKIAAVWKGFRVRSSYILVLLAARRHVRRSAAASIIQTNLKAAATKRKYGRIQASIVIIQSSVRMTISMTRVKRMRAKLIKASNYHSDDCYIYSKQRTASSIRIQATYRMYKLRKKFVVHYRQKTDAAKLLKTQESYLRRYLTRINQVNRKLEEADSYDSGVEVDFEQHKSVCPSLSKKKASNAMKDAHLGMYDFETSKQRQAAATKIQRCFREHLYRSSGCAAGDTNVHMCAGSADIAAQIIDFTCSWFQ